MSAQCRYIMLPSAGIPITLALGTLRSISVSLRLFVFELDARIRRQTDGQAKSVMRLHNNNNN